MVPPPNCLVAGSCAKSVNPHPPRRPGQPSPLRERVWVRVSQTLQLKYTMYTFAFPIKLIRKGRSGDARREMEAEFN